MAEMSLEGHDLAHVDLRYFTYVRAKQWRKGSILLDWEPRLANHSRGAARSKDADILLVESFGQVQQTRLVVDRDNGNLLFRHACGLF